MRKLIIFILIFPALVMAEDLSGHWVWVDNSEKQTFSLKLKATDSNSYTAHYCAVGSSGARIDCSRNGDNSVTFFLNQSFIFKAHYTNVAGEAIIISKDNNLIWQVTKRPQGEHYAPNVAKLVRFQ